MPQLRFAQLAFAGCVLVTNGCFVPKDAQPTVDASAIFASRFVHRGQTQNDRQVLQPSAAVSIETLDGGQVTGTVWANMDLSNSTGDAWLPDGHAGKFTQIDLIGDYTRSFEYFQVRGGIHNYNLPNGLEFPFGERGATSELFATISTEVLGATPYFSFRYDFDEVRASYATLGVGESFPITEDLRIVADGSLSYAASAQSSWLYGVDESGLADLRGSLEIEYDYDERTTFTAGIHGSTIIDSTIEQWFKTIQIDDDVIWVTAGVRWAL